jgi:hypothetical protein
MQVKFDCECTEFLQALPNCNKSGQEAFQRTVCPLLPEAIVQLILLAENDQRLNDRG